MKTKTYPMRRPDGRVVRVTVPENDDEAGRVLAETLYALRQIKRIADRRADQGSMDISTSAKRVLMAAREGM